MGMADCRTVRHVAEWNPQGKRTRGRPVNTWKVEIRGSVRRRNLKGKEMFRSRAIEGEKYVWAEENVFT
jgi:hypothetical protein